MESLHPERKLKRIICNFEEEVDSASSSNEQKDSTATSQENKKKRQRCDSPQLNEHQTKHNLDRSCMMGPLPIECNSRGSLVLTGTACKGGIGPPIIGAVDIGVSKFAYYFRVALPGVKEDPETFSCKIEHNGQIHIRGVTSAGGETVTKYSRIYKMKIQNQRPPGPFSVSFKLPGHVDPRLTALYFRSDGIFEAVVGKISCAAVI